LEQIQYHIKCRKGDVHRAVLLPGDPARATYIAENFFANPRQVSENREFRIFNGLYEGFPLAVCSTGIGCMSSAVAIEELVNVGCKYFLRVGTAGSLQAGIRPGEIVIATGAVRGDGASSGIHSSFLSCSSGFFPPEGFEEESGKGKGPLPSGNHQEPRCLLQGIASGLWRLQKKGPDLG